MPCLSNNHYFSVRPKQPCFLHRLMILPFTTHIILGPDQQVRHVQHQIHHRLLVRLVLKPTGQGSIPHQTRLQPKIILSLDLLDPVPLHLRRSIRPHRLLVVSEQRIPKPVLLAERLHPRLATAVQYRP